MIQNYYLIDFYNTFFICPVYTFFFVVEFYVQEEKNNTVQNSYTKMCRYDDTNFVILFEHISQKKRHV